MYYLLIWPAEITTGSKKNRKVDLFTCSGCFFLSKRKVVNGSMLSDQKVLFADCFWTMIGLARYKQWRRVVNFVADLDRTVLLGIVIALRVPCFGAVNIEECLSERSVNKFKNRKTEIMLSHFLQQCRSASTYWCQTSLLKLNLFFSATSSRAFSKCKQLEAWRCYGTKQKYYLLTKSSNNAVNLGNAKTHERKVYQQQYPKHVLGLVLMR